MKTNNPKDRRSDIRIPLIGEGCEVIIDGTPYLDPVRDVGIGGCFIKHEGTDQIKLHDTVFVNFKLPGDLGNIQMYGSIVHVKWKEKGNDSKGFGVKFETTLDYKHKIWESYLVYIRNKQIITVSKRIIEQMFKETNNL